MKRRIDLITGASSGLGSDFARILAGRKRNLFITARRFDRLRMLKEELEEEFGVDVHVFGADLGDPGGAGSILEELASMQMSVDILVNNAGFGHRTFLMDKPPADWERMIRVNLNSLVALTTGILPSMIENGGGGILNVASTGAFQAVPWFTVYAATKSFVLSFSEGLAQELTDRDIDITVSCLCPGPTRTEFPTTAGADTIDAPDFVWMESREVAEIGLKALEANQTICIPGMTNKLQFYTGKLLPRSFISRVASLIYRPEKT